MSNAYEKMVKELGVDGARSEMARRRSLVKPENLGKGGFKDNPKLAKEMSAKGLKARWGGIKND